MTRVYLSSNMRDENNIEEWIAYHLLIGFDHIFIVDNLSKVPIQKRIKDAGLDCFVTVENYIGEGAVKTNILNGLVLPYMIKNQVDWFIHLDADEYLNLRGNYRNIKEFIAGHQNADIVAINWIAFGTNYHDESKDGLLIDNFTLSSDRCVAHSVKCFVRPNKATHSDHPHYWRMKPYTIAVTANHLPWEANPFNQNNKGLDEPIYINHYVYQSYQDYLRRKVERNRDDANFPRELIPKEELHQRFNDVENVYLKNNYSDKVKEYLRKLKN